MSIPETARHLSLVTDRLAHFYQDVPGFFHFVEGYKRMLNVLPVDRPSTFVEIGSYCGKSAAYLGVELVNRRIPCTLHCVDPWERPNDQDNGAEIRATFDRNLEPVKRLLGERFQPMAMRSLEAAKLFAPASVDVVWVDGDHSYEAVTADILAWFPKLKPGGWMGGDDFLMQPVARAVVEQFAPNYILGHGWTEIPQPQPWPWWLSRAAG